MPIERPTVRPALTADSAEIVRMRTALWPDSTADEVTELLERREPPLALLVAERPEGGLCGYAEVGLRPFAEGCTTSPVGYLEGIWVDADARRGGVATAMLRAGLRWAAGRGAREFASDAGIENAGSVAFHRAAGFDEAGRVVCFRMDVEFLLPV
jgi:aminoglycoside 6'-N-acetyltransferase I